MKCRILLMAIPICAWMSATTSARADTCLPVANITMTSQATQALIREATRGRGIGITRSKLLSGNLATLGIRDDAQETLYLISLDVPLKHSLMGVLRCDKRYPAEIKVMALAWSSRKSQGVMGGNYFEPQKGRASACPKTNSAHFLEKTGETITLLAAKKNTGIDPSLLASSATAMIGLRANADESLYLTLSASPQTQSVAAVLRCDEHQAAAQSLLGFSWSSPKSDGVMGAGT
jgi:hypothetical protein